MSVISTGNNPKALWPGINAWWGRFYNEHPLECTELFAQETSNKAYEEDVKITGFGLAPVKPQGSAVSYDSETQGAVQRYTHVAYGLGYIVTREERKDNLYAKVANTRTKALAFSMRQTKENVAANVYNRAFTSAYAFSDGKELIATDHPTLSGNQSNELATPADLSEASLEDLCIQVADAKNDRGLKISLMPRKLIVATANMFEATRILKSAQQSGTANNDINALKAMNMFPDGAMASHYFTDADAYFVLTNAPEGMKMFTREAIEFTDDGDFDTDNRKYKAYERYSVGCTDWRGIYGSAGA